jgi:hypothetical protein
LLGILTGFLPVMTAVTHCFLHLFSDLFRAKTVAFQFLDIPLAQPVLPQLLPDLLIRVISLCSKLLVLSKLLLSLALKSLAVSDWGQHQKGAD